MNILDIHIANGGGVISGPQGLGILVGEDPTETPAGWIFVDAENPPPDTQAVLDQLRTGRETWPKS